MATIDTSKMSPAARHEALMRARQGSFTKATYVVARAAKAKTEAKRGCFNPVLRIVAPGSVR